MIKHPIKPVYNNDSKILILGSFPSVKSRENQFFYGNKNNRFWKVIAKLLNIDEPQSIEEKKKMLIEHQIALWDVIDSCDIIGSSDSTITNVVANDLNVILNTANINAIFTNGNKAFELYNKYIYPHTKIEPIKLPSTSPANASMNLDKLVKEWQIINKYINRE